MEFLHNVKLAGGVDCGTTVDNEGIQADDKGDNKTLAIAPILGIRFVVRSIPVDEDISVRCLLGHDGLSLRPLQSELCLDL